MILNDYKCWDCGHIHDDEESKPERCDNCGGTNLAWCLENWRTVAFANKGRPINERVHPDTGEMAFHGAADDPLTAIEIGLQDKPGDSSFRTFTFEQQIEFQTKLAKDGDSKKLREEVLATRKANKAKAREIVQKATQ